jgi:hypothetical protein
MRLIILTAVLATLALAAGCSKPTEPRGDPGVCFHVVPLKDGTLKYNKLTENVPNMETCAANLEAMRIKFLRMGGGNRELMGAYQGVFIFVQREGIFAAMTLEGIRYPALVRTGDGRLAIPGAMPQQPQ